jgi:hypothetical protein
VEASLTRVIAAGEHVPTRRRCISAAACGSVGLLIEKGNIAMFLFLTRSRYGPLLQIALGAGCVVIGLFVLTRILLALGGLLILVGIGTAVSRARSARREREDYGGGR